MGRPVYSVLLLAFFLVFGCTTAPGAQGTGSFAFSFQTGGSQPAAEFGNVCSTPSAETFTASAQVFNGPIGWISVTPSGTTTVCPNITANITVSVNVNSSSTYFGPGTYTGQIIINVTGSSNNPLTLPVSLTVTCGVPILIWNNNLGDVFNWNYVIGGELPASQGGTISSYCGVVDFTASSNASWLSISSTGGATPTNLTVEVDPTKARVGTSYGQVTISAPGVLGSPITIYNLFAIQGNSGLTFTAYSTPPIWYMTNGPDGAIWFAGGQGSSSSLGRVTTQGAVTAFPLVTNSNPNAITAGPDGALWFTEEGNGIPGSLMPAQIGRITTSGVVTNQYPLPSGQSVVLPEIVTGPDGALWFTEADNGSAIGRITTDGAITEYPEADEPQALTNGPDGNIWFTSYLTSAIVRMTTAGVTTVYPTQTSAGPTSITVGPDGALWFNLPGELGRITTDGNLTEYPFPPETGGPYPVVTGPDGALWFCAAGGYLVGRMTTSGALSFYNVPSTGIGTLLLGPDGALWGSTPPGGGIVRISGPSISGTTPTTMEAQSPGFTLTVNGSGFISSAIVQWGSTILTTVFISANQLTAVVPSSLLSNPGTVNITVSQNQLVSNAFSFTIGSVTGPQLFLQNQLNNGVSTWFMGGANNSVIESAPWFATAAPNWKLSAVADMNGDGVPDLVFQNSSTNQISIWFMTGANGTTIGTAPIIYKAATDWKVICAADMNGDGVPDLIFQNSSTNQISIWFMNAGGMSFSSAPVIATSAPGWKLATAGDINQDGQNDLVFQNQSTNALSVWFMNPGGASYSSAPIVAHPAVGWTLAAVRDFNGDGIADYVFQNHSTGQVSVWYLTGNQGSTYSSAPIIAAAASGWYVLGAH